MVLKSSKKEEFRKNNLPRNYPYEHANFILVSKTYKVHYLKVIYKMRRR